MTSHSCSDIAALDTRAECLKDSVNFIPQSTTERLCLY